MRLTQKPMEVAAPSWSPDGSKIIFSGQMPGEPATTYVVSAEGGVARQLIDGAEPTWQWSATWSPDGASIAFTEFDKPAIQLLDLASGVVSDMPGTEGLRFPDWSPDGGSLAVMADGVLAVFDIESRQTQQFEAAGGTRGFYWSEDSQWLYFVEDSLAPERSMRRINVHNKEIEHVATLGEQRATFGVRGFWFGVTPGGQAMYLRDVSIHHLYALDWLPE